MKENQTEKNKESTNLVQRNMEWEQTSCTLLEYTSIKKVNQRKKDKSGITALFVASQEGFPESVRLLLRMNVRTRINPH